MKQIKTINISDRFRVLFVILALVAQVMLIVALATILRERAVFLYFIIEIIIVLDIIFLVSKNRNSNFTIAWLLVILALPIVGYVLYVLWGRDISRSRKSKKTQATINRGKEFLEKDSAVSTEFELAHPTRKRISEYLLRNQFPLYKNTSCRYYPLGEFQFEEMLKEMENAERFIFMEYFIVREGALWSKFEEVLIRKAKQGVEIKLLFDDFGSIGKTSKMNIYKLENHGIQVKYFNPVHKSISWLYANYRNHQKISVIDGSIGYTGGTNLSDEYANLYPKLGHWKDAAIRLEGDAVWSLTVAFIQMWETESKTQMNYDNYRPRRRINGAGFYQPFTDDPLHDGNSAETTYRMIINNAKEYVYITTPYLVIDNTMMKSLCSAAMSGCDVRIITPKIWDHWYVHMVTQSNYGELLRAGVKIYEYTPGYVHAKTIISDDDNAIIGSINMDYRSFYLHFENGVWICGAPALHAIRADIEEMFEISEKIKLDEWLRRPIHKKCLQAILRLFAVLF